MVQSTLLQMSDYVTVSLFQLSILIDLEYLTFLAISLLRSYKKHNSTTYQFALIKNKNIVHLHYC
jgi:hypothetical protein